MLTMRDVRRVISTLRFLVTTGGGHQVFPG